MRLTSEAEFSRWLRSKMRGHVQRIESATGAGIPDINWCDPKGHEIWIETKLVIPKRGVLLRKEQFAWGTRRQAQGGSVHVIALDAIEDRVKIWTFPFEILKMGEYLAIAECPEFDESRLDIKDLSVYI